MASSLEQNMCRGAGLCSARLCLCISCWPCGYAAANHRRLYPLLLLQVVSDAYSPAFVCPLSFGDNSSLLVRGGAAFLPPLSAYKITRWFMRSCCVILIQQKLLTLNSPYQIAKSRRPHSTLGLVFCLFSGLISSQHSQL